MPAVLAVFFCSCAEVEDLDQITQNLIYAEMESDDTKTSVTDEGTFSWSAGDKVWLQTTSGKIVGTLASGSGSSNASFTYDSFIGELSDKAIYPYNDDHAIAENELKFALPSSYDLGDALDNTNAAMYGKSDGNTYLFNHLAGVVRFVFKNVPAGVNQLKVTLDRKINGVFTADLSTVYPVITSEETDNDSERTVTLNFNPLQDGAAISLYVPLPLGTYSSLSLELNDSDGPVWTYSKEVENTINRKTLLLMPTVTLSSSVNGDIEGGDSVPVEPTDLSAEGTANCYVVDNSGSFKIKMTKGATQESVGAVNTASVLWESFGTDVTPSVGDLISNVQVSEDYITFDVPDDFKEGNAVIAAKDIDDTVLWSWHIWLVSDEINEYVYSGYTVMDRNLGATSSVAGESSSLGLLYQYGRKDPFLGSSSISEPLEAKSTATWTTYSASTNVTSLLEYATENPTIFLTVPELVSGEQDWDSLYDPCPSGWRVTPTLDIYLSAASIVYEDSGIVVDSKDWYPYAGNRVFSSGQLANTSNYGFYWGKTVSRFAVISNNSISPTSFSPNMGCSVRCYKAQ